MSFKTAGRTRPAAGPAGLGVRHPVRTFVYCLVLTLLQAPLTVFAQQLPPTAPSPSTPPAPPSPPPAAEPNAPVRPTAALGPVRRPTAALGPVAIRGMTIGPIETSQFPGRGYGSAASEALLDALVRLGVNTISVTPFGRVWSLESTEILMDFEAPYSDNRAAIGRMVEQAHARGLRVLLIPHLWVETGGWRGEMNPKGRGAWKAYQKSYREFVLAWAHDAARMGVDAMSIGVECSSWSGRFGDYWSGLIADVRQVFPGPLTYSANWDEVDNVVFWDQLDWIGVNAFYPLARKGHDDYADYVKGAERAIASLERSAQRVRKPVVLVEIGYTTRSHAAIDPWTWPEHLGTVVIDEWEQARALSALMGAATRSPHIGGMFLWRYYADLDDVSQEAPWGFSTHGKLGAHVIQSVYETRWVGDAAGPVWAPPSKRPPGKRQSLLWPQPPVPFAP